MVVHPETKPAGLKGWSPPIDQTCSVAQGTPLVHQLAGKICQYTYDFFCKLCQRLTLEDTRRTHTCSSSTPPSRVGLVRVLSPPILGLGKRREGSGQSQSILRKLPWCSPKDLVQLPLAYASSMLLNPVYIITYWHSLSSINMSLLCYKNACKI